MIFKKTKKRILVADDDEDFLSAIRAVLEFAGFRVDTAEDGEEALKEMRKNRYDLLVLDVVMPKIDGVKLFQMAKKSKKYDSIPVLFVSGYPVWTELEEQKREIVKKSDAYMQKPFQTKIFLEKVQILMNKKKALH